MKLTREDVDAIAHLAKETSNYYEKAKETYLQLLHKQRANEANPHDQMGKPYVMAPMDIVARHLKKLEDDTEAEQVRDYEKQVARKIKAYLEMPMEAPILEAADER